MFHCYYVLSNSNSVNKLLPSTHRLVSCITSCRMLLLGYLTRVKSHPFISLDSLQRQTDIGRRKGNVHRRSWATIELEIIFETKYEVLSLATSTEVGLCRVCCVYDKLIAESIICQFTRRGTARRCRRHRCAAACFSRRAVNSVFSPALTRFFSESPAGREGVKTA